MHKLNDLDIAIARIKKAIIDEFHQYAKILIIHIFRKNKKKKLMNQEKVQTVVWLVSCKLVILSKKTFHGRQLNSSAANCLLTKKETGLNRQVYFSSSSFHNLF